MEAPSSPGTNQEYTVFISYSHSDNKEAGRQWATWLHHSLQTYEVPKELVGKANQRGEPVLASLYPVFRDEEELPADSDLAGNIKWALERSRLLVVICSPRSAKSKFVEEEIRYFKELGKGDYIVPLIVDGEPNAKDAKLECFPNALRFGAPGKDGKIDWSLATLPLGADVRIGGGPEQGWSSAGAYRADLENNTRSFLSEEKVEEAVREYEERLRLARLKVIAGALGLRLGELTRRDKAYQLEQERNRARSLRRWLAVTGVLLIVAIVAGVVAEQRKKALTVQVDETKRQKDAYAAQVEVTNEQKEALEAQAKETQRQIERSWIEEGTVWAERAESAKQRRDHPSLHMMAAYAVGFEGHGRLPQEADAFERKFPPLLGRPMNDPVCETRRNLKKLSLNSLLGEDDYPTFLPQWSSPRSLHHASVVLAVSFNPEGTRLASSAMNGTITVWDIPSGRKVAEVQGRGSESSTPQRGMAFSPNGKYLAFADATRGISLWSPDGQGEALKITSNSGEFAFRPDGKQLAVSISGKEYSSLILVDVATGKVKELEVHDGRGLGRLVFNRDGSLLAGGLDGHVKIWDVTRLTEAASLDGPDGEIFDLAFDPSGDVLAASFKDSSGICRWDVKTGVKKPLIETNGDEVRGLSFSRDGSLLFYGDCDYRLYARDTRTGETREFSERIAVSCLTPSPQGDLLGIGAADGTVKLLEISSGKDLARLQNEPASVASVATCPAGRLMASGSSDGTVRLWDGANGREMAVMRMHKGIVRCIAFSPDGKLLASGGDDGFIRFWEIPSGEMLWELRDPKGEAVRCIAFSPDGSLLAGGDEAVTTRIWSLAEKTEVRVLTDRRDPSGPMVRCLAFSPDGEQLASGGTCRGQQDGMTAWRVSDGQELKTFANGYGSLAVAYSPEGTEIAVAQEDGKISLWSRTDFSEILTLAKRNYDGEILEKMPASLAFGADGFVACGRRDGKVEVWGPPFGEKLSLFSAHQDWVTSLAFSPDGTRLLSGSMDCTMRVWDSGQHKALITHNVFKNVFSDWVVAQGLSPNDECFSAISAEGVFKIWEARTGICVATFTSPLDELNAPSKGLRNAGFAFSPDGSRILSTVFFTPVKTRSMTTGREVSDPGKAEAEDWINRGFKTTSLDQTRELKSEKYHVRLISRSQTGDDIAEIVRSGLLGVDDKAVTPLCTVDNLFENHPFPMLHARHDLLCELSDPQISASKKAELEMTLCARSGQVRAAIAQWERLQADAGAKDIVAVDSAVREIYLLALIKATQQRKLLGRETVLQILGKMPDVLTKEVMAKRVISLAMMGVVDSLEEKSKSDPEMKTAHEAIVKVLETTASLEWLEAMRQPHPAPQWDDI